MLDPLYSLFVRLCTKMLPMEKRLHVFVCQTFAHHSYPEFDQKLRELRAIPLMHSIWAARTVLTAKELKEMPCSRPWMITTESLWWKSPRAGPAGEQKTIWAIYFHPEGVRLSYCGSSAGENE